MATKCTECGHTFSTETKLHEHKLNTLHNCEHCQYPFSSRDDVKTHMRTHKLYPCTICSKGFFLDRSLTQHMGNSTHTKKRKRRSRKKGQGTPHVSSTLPPPFVQELRPYDDVERYLREVVEPDRENVENCGKVIDDIVDFLHHRVGLNVAEVFKGGSLAKGTGIKLKNDIDLAVFLNDTTMVELEQGMKARLLLLKDRLRHGGNFNDKLTFTPGRELTGHSVQFQLAGSRTDVPHDVDILPAVDVIRQNGPDDVYERMKEDDRYKRRTMDVIYQRMKEDRKSRPFYSVCLGKLQVDFVKRRSGLVKSLIRLIKHWKVREGLLELKSYSVELIVIKLWQDWGEPEAFDLWEKMREVLRFISNLGNKTIVWPDEYDISEYGGSP